MFIWLVTHNRLPLNEYIARIGIADSDVCTRCQRSAEIIVHLLRDCPKSKAVWHFVLTNRMYDNFFNLDLKQWLDFHTSDLAHWSTSMPHSWPQFFVSILWTIWKHRNEEIFQNQEFNAYRVWINAFTLTMDLQIQEGQCPTLGDPLNGLWVKPPPSYLKLNVDGGFRDGKAVYCGVLRDDMGQWIWGYAGCFTGVSPLSAEIKALMEELI